LRHLLLLLCITTPKVYSETNAVDRVALWHGTITSTIAITKLKKSKETF